MSDSMQNGFSNGAGYGEAERTLRLIASLPAPEGLEDRVRAGLRSTPRTPRLLAWPAAFSSSERLSPVSGWMRSAAAAAIVCVVAGGGWSIYSRVQPGQIPRGVVVPHVGAPGGFSAAGTARLPLTLNGPAVMHPSSAVATQAAPAAKAPVKPAATKGRAVHAKETGKESVPPVASSAK
jgi:hypothetical protein